MDLHILCVRTVTPGVRKMTYPSILNYSKKKGHEKHPNIYIYIYTVHTHNICKSIIFELIKN